jgi:uncharacterized membrane protein
MTAARQSAAHALYEKGVMKDLGTLGGAFSEAFAINERGDIVGQAETPTGNFMHFFTKMA